MDAVVARKCWRTLEPYHGLIYFLPEAGDAFTAIGLDPRHHYFASRAAPMGAVPAEVVVATFFNFAPGVVHHAMDGVWDRVAPEALLAARLDAADAALRRALGPDVTSAETAEAAELATTAAAACTSPGRPLYAGHATLPWPEPAHLRLWHAITLLREHRGDGHIAALVLEGIDGGEALVLHGATGEVPVDLLRATRGWPEDEWAGAVSRLRARGWVAEDASLTDVGRGVREAVEQRTDEAALAPWAGLGAEGCDRLRALVRPWSRTIVEGGTFSALP